MSQLEFVDPRSERIWTAGWDPALQTWYAGHEPWPPRDDAELVYVIGTTPHEAGALPDFLRRLEALHGVTPPPEVLGALSSPDMQVSDTYLRFWDDAMIGGKPWEIGTEHQRWDGYLDPDTWDPEVGAPVLRNLVGARTYDELRQAEDVLVPMRAAEIADLGLPATFDLDGLRSIHRQLFQDVYEWAGELRTVDMAKGYSRFVAADQLETAWAPISDALRYTDLLRTIPEREYPGALAETYVAVLVAHVSREGNGRSTREFITALAAQSGHKIDWTRVTGPANDAASEEAHHGRLDSMLAMFERIVSRETPTHARLPQPQGPRSGARTAIGANKNARSVMPRASSLDPYHR